MRIIGLQRVALFASGSLLEVKTTDHVFFVLSPVDTQDSSIHPTSSMLASRKEDDGISPLLLKIAKELYMNE